MVRKAKGACASAQNEREKFRNALRKDQLGSRNHASFKVLPLKAAKSNSLEFMLHKVFHARPPRAGPDDAAVVLVSSTQ